MFVLCYIHHHFVSALQAGTAVECYSRGRETLFVSPGVKAFAHMAPELPWLSVATLNQTICLIQLLEEKNLNLTTKKPCQISKYF